MTDVTYARLLVAEPGRWRTAAAAWRALAAWTAERSAEFGPHVSRLRAVWSGSAAQAAVARLAALRRRLHLARLGCWEADQVLCEFADALGRSRALLVAALDRATRAGLAIDADGGVGGGALVGPGASGAAVRTTVAALGTALAVAARADAAAAGRLAELSAVTTQLTGPDPGPAGLPVPLPPCGATPGEVHRWWTGLTAAERRWVMVAEPAAAGALDGVPASFRDLANRLLLDDRRAELNHAVHDATGGELRRLRGLRSGLDALADRLVDTTGPRAYLLELDLAEDGRAIVALGDPDLADNVLTHVPGMTADLASVDGELVRAARVADRARSLAPEQSTSALLWLDYDAPDFLDEAAGARRAEVGAETLRRFQDGLRVTHDGGGAHRTVLGHSYGSLVVGTAAARTGLAADSVVFVGSPGVGVDSVTGLHSAPGQVWSTTSESDVIQYTAVAPGDFLRDLAVTHLAPAAVGPPLFGRPEDDLWHGHNPSDPEFGARVFATGPDAGHLGYWDPGRPDLDALANITLGGAYQDRVR
jgi:hypothetical protein